MIPTAHRVLLQLRHDPRTVAMLALVPAVLLVLVRFVLNDEAGFRRSAPALLAILPFTLMFLVTSISTLRERTSGTLERLLTTPLRRSALLGGSALAFGSVAVAQSSVALGTAAACGQPVGDHLAWWLLGTLVSALLGVGLGLLASAFARTEFQAVQFMPVVVLPQVLLCGLFRPRDEMADVLQAVSDVLPLTYAVRALQRLALGLTADAARDILVVAAYAVVAVLLAAGTLRRQTD